MAGGALKGKIGRPKFTERARETIYKALSSGLDTRAASALAGIDNSTFWRWHKRGETAPEGSQYREFYLRCEQSLAEFSAGNVEFIAAKRPDDWRAAAWLQERRFPNQWGPPKAAPVSGEQSIQIELVLTDGRQALPSSTVEVIHAEGDSPADTA